MTVDLVAPLPRWEVSAAEQDGVLTRGQALEGGLTLAGWRWRTHRDWQTPLPGVAVTHNGPLTDVQRRWAALLYCGQGAALSGDAALVEHGLSLPPPAVLHIAVPAERSVVPRQFIEAGQPALGVVTHRTTGLAEFVRWRHGLAVVQVEVAALQAAAWATSDRVAEWRLAAVVQQRLTTVSALEGALARMPRLRRRSLLVRVLTDVALGAHALTELDFLRLLRRHGLPAPDQLQLRVRANGTRYLDAFWARQRVIVELDGAHHREVRAWDADTLRGNEIQLAAGAERVVILRLTASNMRHDEAAVVRQLRRALLG